MKKRYLVEFGTGVDIHGGDVTKASKKALKDAISHCCMTGLSEIFSLNIASEDLYIDVKLSSPSPDQVNVDEVIRVLPKYKNLTCEVVQGGATVPGLEVADFGTGSTIVIVIATVTISIDRP